jgi:hypothetical protein
MTHAGVAAGGLEINLDDRFGGRFKAHTDGMKAE